MEAGNLPRRGCEGGRSNATPRFNQLFIEAGVDHKHLHSSSQLHHDERKQQDISF